MSPMLFSSNWSVLFGDSIGSSCVYEIKAKFAM